MTRLGEFVGCVTVGVVAAVIIVVAASPPTPPPAPEPTPVTGQVPQGDASDDEPGWNCLTQGNLECGPVYHPLTAGQLQAITTAHAGFDDWRGCLTDDVTVVCDDGYVYVWEEVTVHIGGLV